jgi:nucleotide-binding universal stress UspA family protein
MELRRSASFVEPEPATHRMSSTVICALDEPTPVEAVVLSHDLAQRLDARLILAHAVVDVIRPRARSEQERVAIFASDVLVGERMLRERAEAAGVADAEIRCAVSEPVQWLTALVRDEGADLLVVAPRDLHPVRKLVSGSVSSALSRRATCPVVALPIPALRRAGEPDRR